MADPTFGSIGRLRDDASGTDFDFMLLSNRTSEMPRGLWIALVVAGNPYYVDGQLGPGDIGPIMVDNDEIEWLPRAEPKGEHLTIYYGHPAGKLYDSGPSVILTPVSE